MAVNKNVPKIYILCIGTKRNVCMIMVIPSKPWTCTQKNLSSRVESSMAIEIQYWVVSHTLCKPFQKDWTRVIMLAYLTKAVNIHSQGDQVTGYLCRSEIGKSQKNHSGEGECSMDTWGIQSNLVSFHTFPTSQPLLLHAIGWQWLL